jgi:hypothetical protein
MDATCDSTSQIDDIIDATSKDTIPYNLNAMEFDFILSDSEFDFTNPLSNQKTGLFADPKSYLNDSSKINCVVAKLTAITTNRVHRMAFW